MSTQRDTQRTGRSRAKVSQTRSERSSRTASTRRATSGGVTRPSSRTAKRSAAPRANGTARPARAKAAQRPKRPGAGGAVLDLLQGSLAAKIALALAAVALVLAAVWAIDKAVHAGRVLDNVSIGGVSVAGMNEEEATAAVRGYYEPLVDKGSVMIYRDQESLESQARNDEYDTSVVWEASAASVNAAIDFHGLFEQALEQGRGGLLDRIDLMRNERDVPVELLLDDVMVEELATIIDNSLGEPYADSDIEIDDGFAYVVEGHDGYLVDRGWLRGMIGAELLSTDDGERAFVAQASYTVMRITPEAAQRTADEVNAAIAPGARFSYEGDTFTLSSSDLGELVDTRVEDGADGAQLVPFVNETRAHAMLLSFAPPRFEGDGSVAFRRDGDAVLVDTSATGRMPQTDAAAKELDEDLFAAYRSGVSNAAFGTAPLIELSSTDVPSSMTFDEALSYGVIDCFSAYTTEYTTSNLERNTNIHLAAEKIDGSIVSSGGGVWSFNGTVGETTAEDGYQVAGVVVGNTHDDDIGGGICQVATTVFNAVYEAGLPVVERHNHSLYIGSYPEGRDAAVSWETPDLKWENDTTSDIYVRMHYTESTVTCELYGVGPGYEVSTQVGNWEEGAPYTTIYQTDPDIAPTSYYIEQLGVDGHSITVERTVTDSDGNVVRTDSFNSTYRPQDCIVIRGTDCDVTVEEEHMTFGDDEDDEAGGDDGDADGDYGYDAYDEDYAYYDEEDGDEW